MVAQQMQETGGRCRDKRLPSSVLKGLAIFVIFPLRLQNGRTAKTLTVGMSQTSGEKRQVDRWAANEGGARRQGALTSYCADEIAKTALNRLREFNAAKEADKWWAH